MGLRAGTRLGSYEIVAPLGAGGMGEVYRARDTRLGREVAVKVLPEAVASSPDRLARFERRPGRGAGRTPGRSGSHRGAVPGEDPPRPRPDGPGRVQRASPSEADPGARRAREAG